ncbi:thyrotropin-releasing hormone-degrading ectoenzyme-like [Cottoperca gobio]|uniref:Thyrotropin-releasing hormone-degrading ectoenzyme-like n=1 Tax=Cottoperca gobio TaxID=56716 RepID=A0A6J2PF07_COTGO|nr:thyrotropin-releasing hormone-degrading ectoenzyme-like [Cottoperca gobio]
MGLNDSSPGAMRNGRGLSDQWAETVVVRPRTTERHITVHKRLVLGFALSILTLIIVTAVAVVLSVRFEECGGRDREGATGESGSRGSGGSAKLNGSRGERGDEEGVQPWRNLRLPGSVRPRHYDLRLVVYMDNFTFSGEVSIELECINATRFIVLHTDRLEVDRVSVSAEGGGGRPANRPGGGVMRIHRHFHHPASQMYVVVLHRELKPMRVYRLNMSFDAAIEDELLGFFRSSYIMQREKRYLAVTQFSPIHARKAFPCFDEPIYKATFSLTLRHDPQYTSLSNMPVESSSLSDEDSWLTNRFARTPRMSTYYLAWAVCNFTYRETQTDSGVTIRLYARPDAISSGAGDYALHITKRLLGFYQDYFKVQYSLPKLGSFNGSAVWRVKEAAPCVTAQCGGTQQGLHLPAFLGLLSDPPAVDGIRCFCC